jgi:hypothetical protein
MRGNNKKKYQNGKIKKGKEVKGWREGRCVAGGGEGVEKGMER